MRYLIILFLLVCSPLAAAETWAKEIYYNYYLPFQNTEIKHYTRTFVVFEPSVFRAYGHIDTKHRGVYIPDKAVMIAFKIKHNGNWLKGSTTVHNIMSRAEHYGVTVVHGYKILQPGVHTFSVWMRAVSTWAPGQNSIAYIKGGYNQVVYEVTPI